MNRKPQERGQALILIVFAAIGLFAFAALAIDGSRVFSDRRHAQNAADTSVLAAALAKVRAQDYAAAAQTRALSNGFNNGVNSTVEVHLCDEAGLDPACEGLPTGANPAEYIQVVIRMVTPTTFARIIGFNEVPTVVTAVARASGSSVTGSSSNAAALFATQKDGWGCFDMNGGANLALTTHGSGIYVNCNHPQAVTLGGSPTLQMDTNGQVVGCYVPNGNPTFSPIDCGANGGVPQTFSASSFASVPTTQAPPACGGPGSVSGNTYSPGSYSSIVITSGTTIMNPGVYCVSGSITVVGGATLSGPSGKVQIVLGDQSMTLSGKSLADFVDLEIYSNNGSLLVTGGNPANPGGALRADRLRFFSTGSGTVDLGGQAEITSGNAYFYLDQGNIRWNGGSVLNLHGPPQGDTFGGLLIHKPFDNHEDIILNGGSNIDLTGTFMVPGSHVRINGDANFDLHSQIIGSTFTVAGSAQVDIFYDPNENYSPPNSPVIQLTK